MNSSFGISDEQYKTGRKPNAQQPCKTNGRIHIRKICSPKIIARAYKVSALAPFSARPEDHTGNNENYTCLY
jgi:hypothetical protein